MAKLLKLRRGTTSQHSSFTGAEGEVTIDTDKDTAVVHDGSTAAGRPLAREDLNNVASASITGRLASGSIATAKIADDAITTAKIADDAITSPLIADNSIHNALIQNATINQHKIADNQIVTSKIADDAVTSAKIADGAITSAHIAADTVVAADIAANAVGTSEIAADAVTGAQIADNSINSEHYVDGSIDDVHLANNAVARSKIAADAVDGTKIADDAINSEHYVDGSIDAVHIASNSLTAAQLAGDAVGNSEIQNDAVTGSKIADNAINSEHYVDSSIDREHLNVTNSGSNGQALTRNGSQFTWSTISPDGGNAATVDGIDSSQFLRSDAADSASGDITFAGGAGAATIGGNSDMRLHNGSWTGDTAHAKIQHHNNQLYICGGTGGIRFRENGDDRCQINGDGHLVPTSNNTYDLGSSSYRWRNLYINDLQLSNEGHSNDIDGTWGNWTIQEGEDDLFLLNRRNGKQYKFTLTEVN